MKSSAFVFAGAAVATEIPTMKLNNGVEMPMMSLGTWQYDSATAQAAVTSALKSGFNHIDTANDYNNQDGVGAALKGVDRSSYFLTTKVPPGSASATAKALQQNLDLLALDYVDLVLVHYPPLLNSCKSMQAQWGAMEEFYKAGKAKAIGVSNYCPSSLECIAKTATVTPAVNQVQYHVGMGVDPIGVKSYCEEHNIHLQAYSPLGDGSTELITGDLVSGIGGSHNKTGAQVSLRWIYENGVSLTTKTTNEQHMQEDLDVFNFQLAADEKQTLDSASSPAGKPSFMCNSAVEV
jgi:diketogulonate reductase-like aldo/keto reductase